jgi:hypothetical protein
MYHLSEYDLKLRNSGIAMETAHIIGSLVAVTMETLHIIESLVAVILYAVLLLLI